MTNHKRIRRFRVEHDHHVRCCCSMEEHLSGEYVLLEDYMNLLREYSEYRGTYTKPDDAQCAYKGENCTGKAVIMWSGRPHCEECLPPMMKPGGAVRPAFDPSD